MPTTDNSLTGPAESRLRRNSVELAYAAIFDTVLRKVVEHGHGAANLDFDIADCPAGAAETSASLCFCSHAENQSTGPAVTRMPSTTASRL